MDSIRKEDLLKQKLFQNLLVEKYSLGMYYIEKGYTNGISLAVTDDEILSHMKGQPSDIFAILLIYKADAKGEDLWSYDLVLVDSADESSDTFINSKVTEYFDTPIQTAIEGMDYFITYCMKLLYFKER